MNPVAVEDTVSAEPELAAVAIAEVPVREYLPSIPLVRVLDVFVNPV